LRGQGDRLPNRDNAPHFLLLKITANFIHASAMLARMGGGATRRRHRREQALGHLA